MRRLSGRTARPTTALVRNVQSYLPARVPIKSSEQSHVDTIEFSFRIHRRALDRCRVGTRRTPHYRTRFLLARSDDGRAGIDDAGTQWAIRADVGFN